MLHVITLVLLPLVLATGSVTCPDGKLCPDRTTCCETQTGGYECCPVPNAICCPDKAHCCPQGFQCNLQTQMCERRSGSMPMLRKIPAEQPNLKPSGLSSPSAETQDTMVHCDNYHVCPDGTTCCKGQSGQWTCCPFSPATCCADGIHCCPFGYHCDPSSTSCFQKNDLEAPFITKLSALNITATKLSTINLKIPKLAQQDDCCLSSKGCCPAGFHCDEHKACVRDSSHYPWTELQQSLSTGSQDAVIACDIRFYCPAGNTCCKTPTGQWGCCPYPLGSCCTDGQHCCEYGYTCDQKSQKCVNGYASIYAALKKAAKRN